MIYIIKIFTEELSGTGETVFTSDVEKDAFKIVENNIGDLYECGSYPYAMIGAVDYGLYQVVDELKWYKWDNQKRQYLAIDRPECLNHYAFMI